MKLNLKGILVFTAIETVGVAAWFALIGAGHPWIAVAVLLAGLVLEHVFSSNVKRGRSLFNLPSFGLYLRLLLIAGVETATWAGWLALTDVVKLLAVIVLFGGLLVGHVFELNTLNAQPLRSQFLFRARQALVITGIETGVAIGWVALAALSQWLAAIALFAGLFVEHILSARIPVVRDVS